MHIKYNDELPIKHINWNKEVQDDFESFLVTAELLDYGLQKSASKKDHKFNKYCFKLRNKKMIVILFKFSELETIDSISVLTKTKDQVFTNNQFTEAISFMKSVL